MKNPAASKKKKKGEKKRLRLQKIALLEAVLRVFQG